MMLFKFVIEIFFVQENKWMSYHFDSCYLQNSNKILRTAVILSLLLLRQKELFKKYQL